MSALEVFCIYLAEVFRRCRTNLSSIDQVGYGIEDLTLTCDILRGEQRSCKHQLLMDRHGFDFERHDVETFRIIDKTEAALRRDEFSYLRHIGFGMAG